MLTVISFQNQGKTIPQQKLTTLFDKFFRLDDARTSNTGGAGLGLAIAQTYTESVGGSFHVSIEGDQFSAIVELPAAEENAVI